MRVSKRIDTPITNMNDKLRAYLEETLHFSSDPRIKFVGTVYDKELLKKIRENAYGYFHGHEVGGTNPSLLEALGSTELNLLLDVGFNKEVGQEAALYWKKDDGDLAGLIDRSDEMARGKKTITSNRQKYAERGWETDGERNDVKKKVYGILLIAATLTILLLTFQDAAGQTPIWSSTSSSELSCVCMAGNAVGAGGWYWLLDAVSA